jgi:hypothetical protein
MLESVFSYASWLENDIGSNIIDFVDKNKYSSIPKREVDTFLRENRIDYHDLPQYLKNKLDELDVY